MSRRWLVQPGDPPTLEGVLARMESLDAIAQGRAFVGKRRASRPDHPLGPGDVVTVYPPRAAGDDEPRVLDRRDGVVALYKPAALPTVADHRGDRSLLRWASQQLKTPEPHPTSRLDVGVSGVLLLALDERARARLAEARERGLYRRRYLAVASPPSAPLAPEGVWAWPIGKTTNPSLRAVGGRDPEEATTHHQTLATSPGGHLLLSLRPVTGRTHQLRVHAAHAKAPLLGDTAYGGPARLVSPTGAVTRLTRIALHAHRVEVPDARGNPWLVEAPPDAIEALWLACGGSGDQVG